MDTPETHAIAAQNLIRSTNWTGMVTLYRRELWRFMKVWNQTIMAPVITTLLWLAILTLALGGRRGGGVEALPFDMFIAPGLVMMAVMQNAFANTSSSLMLSKMQGTIIDILMPPLTADEITLSYIAGGVSRGVMVGLAVAAAMLLFVSMPFTNPLLAVAYVLLASILLAQLGMLAGLWAQGYDQMSAVTSYVITPLTFLSGTFYSIGSLPDFWHGLCLYNPFFYLIDGFRYAITGYHDGSITAGLTALCALNIGLWLVVRGVIKRGWRLKN